MLASRPWRKAIVTCLGETKEVLVRQDRDDERVWFSREPVASVYCHTGSSIVFLDD